MYGVCLRETKNVEDKIVSDIYYQNIQKYSAATQKIKNKKINIGYHT